MQYSRCFALIRCLALQSMVRPDCDKFGGAGEKGEVKVTNNLDGYGCRVVFGVLEVRSVNTTRTDAGSVGEYVQ